MPFTKTHFLANIPSGHFPCHCCVVPLKCPFNYFYVGETTQHLKTRICENVWDDEKFPVARHSSAYNHNDNDLCFMGTEVVQVHCMRAV